jgi:purine-binding chemotaxis protein CheW
MFRLGSERYALDIQAVRGVRPLGRMTRVPGTPAFYRGVVNLRGQIVSVIDLRSYFGVALVEDRPPKELILATAAGLDVALLAHHIEDVATLPKTAVEPVEIRSARGIAPGRLIVLDAEQLFADERLIVGESAE